MSLATLKCIGLSLSGMLQFGTFAIPHFNLSLSLNVYHLLFADDLK